MPDRTNSSVKSAFRAGMLALIITVVAELMLIFGLCNPFFGLFGLILRIVTLPTEHLCTFLDVEISFTDGAGRFVWPTFFVPLYFNTLLFLFVGFVVHKALGLLGRLLRRLDRFFWPERRHPPEATTNP